MKYLFLLVLFMGVMNAGIIDGVAIKVDGNIITLYQIKEVEKKDNVDENKAKNILIKERIKENEIKRLGIKVDDSKVEDEINNIVISNGITRDELKDALKAQGVDFETYKKRLREHIINRELMQKILQTSPNITNEDDLKRYYEENKTEFAFPTKIKVTSYTSTNDAALQQFLRNPITLNPNITSKEEEIDLKSLPQQIVNVFLQTPEKKFTPVLNSGNTLIVFFIKEKIDKEILPFDEIRENVLQKYTQARENDILNDYFDKIRANANIEFLRS